MRFVNTSRYPMYCSAAGDTVAPGERTSDRDGLVQALARLRAGASGLSIMLSDAELDAMDSLLSEHIRSEEAFAAGVRPGRARSISERIAARRAAAHDAAAARVNGRHARDSAASAESLAVDASGNPVADAVSSKAAEDGVKPELHPEMSGRMSDILANNRAIMEQFRKAPNVVVAGQTKVSHDPADYQKAK